LHNQLSNYKFMIKGVITGDLVDSTNIAAKWRQTVVNALHKCVAESLTLTPIKLDMYRGDSFQVLVDNPEYVLAIGIALRAKLKAETPDKQNLWDARLSVGVGEISFESSNIVTSDGEAFRLSGRSFDHIGKKRLTIATPWLDFNNDIELVTRFADDVITSWTAKQAKVVYQSILFPKLQKDLAEELGMTRQNFNYHWSSARGQLILDYIKYFKSLISKYTK
jgi:hypothetical protein